MTGVWEINVNGKKVGHEVEGMEVAGVVDELVGKVKTGDVITINCLLEE